MVWSLVIASIRRYRSCLISRRSTTASAIQSQSASWSKSSRILPIWIRLSASLLIKPGESGLCKRSKPRSATELTFSPSLAKSNNQTSTPALAT